MPMLGVNPCFSESDALVLLWSFSLPQSFSPTFSNLIFLSVSQRRVAWYGMIPYNILPYYYNTIIFCLSPLTGCMSHPQPLPKAWEIEIRQISFQMIPRTRLRTPYQKNRWSWLWSEPSKLIIHRSEVSMSHSTLFCLSPLSDTAALTGNMVH